MLFVEHLDRPKSVRFLGEQDGLTVGVGRTGDHGDRSDLALLFTPSDRQGEGADLVGGEFGGEAGHVEHFGVGTGVRRIDALHELDHVLRV